MNRRDRSHGRARNKRPVRNVECLVDMEFPLIARRVGAVIVMDPVCKIRVLLDFGNKNPRAHGMNRAGLNVKGVALFHVYTVQNGCDCLILDMLKHFFFRDFSGETVINIRAFFGIQDIPHFGLPGLTAVDSVIFVSGMNLDGKVLVGIDKLDKDRKSGVRRTVGSEYFLKIARNYLRKRLAREIPVQNDRSTGRMTGQHPCFRYRRIACPDAEFPVQTISAPQV